DARAAAVRPRGLGADALPRGRGVRLELHRDAAACSLAPLRGGGCTARGARAADAAHDRERLRADGADLARRLGDGRSAPCSDRREPSRARPPLRDACRRDAGARDMKIVRTAAELALDGDVGLVPTMGALHDGHRALFRAARAESELVVASLFVNPAQFNVPADLAAYPRDETRDAEIAQAEGVDVLFAPSQDEMYPPGFATWIDVDDTGAEGAARPGHFRGVATVCVKLFNIVRPQRAYFGQKDAQQVGVIRRVVRDLNLPLEIRVVETVRDEDGLAFSSRNVLLSAEERR